MSVEVKGVTDVVKDISRLKDKAGKVAESLRGNIGATEQALDMTQDLSDTLGAAAAELRGVLGVNTNSPPQGERIEDEGAPARGRPEPDDRA